CSAFPPASAGPFRLRWVARPGLAAMKGATPRAGGGRGQGPARLLQLRGLPQLLGAIGLLPGEGRGLVLLAGAVGVADLLGLAAEVAVGRGRLVDRVLQVEHPGDPVGRSEEHTSELQSRENLVCRLL